MTKKKDKKKVEIKRIKFILRKVNIRDRDTFNLRKSKLREVRK